MISSGEAIRGDLASGASHGWRKPGMRRFEVVNPVSPADIAATYLHLIRQPRSAWTQEIEVRPWVEKF
jgi:NADP-dependent 3-hydroxy acid dehydrogenase YdfG